MNVVIRGRCGLGDNIYWRPLVRAATEHADVFLATPWPELFTDLRVTPIAPVTRLRTQRKNIRRNAVHYRRLPRGAKSVVLRYDWGELAGSNVFEVMARRLPFACETPVFDLPDFGRSPVSSPYPVAVVRPVTERTEWLNTARNPRPEYVADAAARLRTRGYWVVVVADLQRRREWLVGPGPSGDAYFVNGELTVARLLALVQRAAIVVGPVGWIVPACIASRTPLIAIGGGEGGHNAPERLVDARMDASLVRFITPEPQCPCVEMLHDCPKEIADFGARFDRALDDLERQAETRGVA